MSSLKYLKIAGEMNGNRLWLQRDSKAQTYGEDFACGGFGFATLTMQPINGTK